MLHVVWQLTKLGKYVIKVQIYIAQYCLMTSLLHFIYDITACQTWNVAASRLVFHFTPDSWWLECAALQMTSVNFFWHRVTYISLASVSITTVTSDRVAFWSLQSVMWNMALKLLFHPHILLWSLCSICNIYPWTLTCLTSAVYLSTTHCCSCIVTLRWQSSVVTLITGI